MADLTQKIKYAVDVDLTQLNSLKTALDAAETAAKGLGTALDKLANSNVKGLRQLGGVVKALGTRMGGFATDIAPAMTALAQISTVIGQIGQQAAALSETSKALKSLNQSVVQHGKEVEKAEKKTGDWRLSMLKYYGSFHAIRYTLTNLFAEIREGAQQVDLENTLTKQFAGFRKEIERAQAATLGTVGEGQLTRSFALMSSFGIPMDQFAENMELVQKMAIRTGQSADFLADSFARGISRLSPLILDNLGIQVSLKDANDAYSAATGKSVESMTKQERVGALLNQTLIQLKANTEGVSLAGDSLSASVNRASVAYEDFLLGVKKMIGTGFAALSDAFAGSRADASYLATAFERLGQGLAGNTGQQLADYAKMLSGLGDIEADTLERWDMFGRKGWWGGGGKHLTQLTNDIDRVSSAYERLRLLQLTAPAGPPTGFRTMEMDDVSRAMTAMQGIDSAAMEATVPFLEWRKALGDVNIQAEIFIQKNKDSLSLAQQEEIRRTAIAKAQEAYTKEFARVQQLGEKNNVSLGLALATWFNLIPAVKTVTKELEEQFRLSEEKRKANLAENAAWAFFKNQADARLAAQERLNKIHAGMLPIDLEIEEAQARVTEARKRLAETNKKIAEDRLTEELRSARLMQTEDVRRALAIEDEARTRKSMLDAWVIQYRGATNAQIEMDAKRIDAIKEVFQAIAAAVGQANAEVFTMNMNMAKGMEEAAKKLRALKVGGGGGGGHKDAKPEKPDQGWNWDYEGVFGRQEAEAKALEAFKEAAERLRTLRSVVRRALVEAPSGRAGQDALAEIMKQFAQLEDTYGSEKTHDMLTMLLGYDFVPEVYRARDATDALADSFDHLIKVSEGFKSVSDVLGEFQKGMSSIHGDLFGGEFISMVDDLGGALDNLAEIQIKNAEATDQSHNAYNNVLGGIGAMRAFTQNLIKDRKDQAKVEMLMQAAAAWAAWAIPDPVKAMGHTIAATMYGAVGFGAIKLPSGKPKSTTPRESRGGGGGDIKRPDIHIHIAGNVVQTEAERGVMAAQAIAEARRRGMM